MRRRDTVRQGIEIADRLQTRYAPTLRRITLQEPYREGRDDDRRQTAWDALRELRHEDTYQQREHTDTECPPVHMHMLRVEDPFIDEVCRHILQTHAEEIIHLRTEDRQRDTCRETHDNRVGHKLDHITQMRQTHQY